MTAIPPLEFDGAAPNNGSLARILSQLAAEIGAMAGFPPGPTPALLTSGVLAGTHYMGGFSANAPQSGNRGESIYIAVADAVGWGPSFTWLNSAGDVTNPSAVVPGNQPFLMADFVYAYNGTSYQPCGSLLFEATGEAFTGAGKLPTVFTVTTIGASGGFPTFYLTESNGKCFFKLAQTDPIQAGFSLTSADVITIRNVDDSADRDIQVRWSRISGNGLPADGELAAGQLILWFDDTNGAAKLMIKAKQADGTVRTGSVALT